jgi:SAM-dependent methyltransferase
MPTHARVARACSMSIFVAAAGLGAFASANEEPSAPFVPTVEEDVELMLDVAGVGPGDYVVDLGSGDGRIVISAARRGALGHGIEIDPELVALSRANARGAGVALPAAFFEGDLFEADIAAASVVTLYLFPEVNLALRPKLLAELTPGTRVVSNSFDMGDWRPDVHDLSARSSGGILLWIIPANSAGEWALEIDGEPKVHRLLVEQRYQEIEARFDELDDADAASASGAVWSPVIAHLHADRITFLVERGDRSFAFGGRVDGDTMTGYVQIADADGERLRRWRASR